MWGDTWGVAIRFDPLCAVNVRPCLVVLGLRSRSTDINPHTHHPNMQGEGKATARAYGSATHFKANATAGKTRIFVGLYNFELFHQTNVVRGVVEGGDGRWGLSRGLCLLAMGPPVRGAPTTCARTDRPLVHLTILTYSRSPSYTYVAHAHRAGA